MERNNRAQKIIKYAKRYRQLGLYPVPISVGSKQPTYAGWPDLRLEQEEIAGIFETACNIAILLGIDNLADVDKDILEAIRAARYFLPITEWLFGRSTKPESHSIFFLKTPIPTIQLRDPVRKIIDPRTGKEKAVMIIELRCRTKANGIGHISVFPPSLHYSGEEIKFAAGKHANGRPPVINTDDLVTAFYKTAAAALLASHWPPSGGGRHECMLALAGMLAQHSWPEEQTSQFCDAVYRSLSDPDTAQFHRVHSEVSSTYKKHREDQNITGASRLASLLDSRVVNTALSWLGVASVDVPADPPSRVGVSQKTTIEVSDKDQETLTEETLEALYTANIPARIFTQLQSIVIVSGDKRNNISVKEATAATLRHHVHRATRFTDRGKACRFPSEVPQDILALSTADLKFPELESIIRSPVMRRDGSIISLPGYDEATSLLYIDDPSLQVPTISLEPTKEDAQVAVNLLIHHLREFPFAEPSSEANALGAILTPIVRPVIDAPVPLALTSAVSPASGKTTLSDLVSIVGTGNYGGYMGAPTNPEEWSKRITSALRKGASVIVIDNVKDTQTIDSPDLCRLITDREWADRELQFSREIRIPNRALWLATGNNIKVGGDMGTRCFLIKLDAGPDPASRKFSTDTPHELWKRERGNMLAATLTAARAWFVAGCPRPVRTPQTRFAEWVRVIGGILEYSGVFDFLANYEELRASTDVEAAEWERFHGTVSDLFTGSFQMRELVAQLELKPALKDSLPTSLRGLVSKPDIFAMALAKEYASRENRPYGKSGIKVTRLGVGHANAMKYQIVVSK